MSVLIVVSFHSNLEFCSVWLDRSGSGWGVVSSCWGLLQLVTSIIHTIYSKKKRPRILQLRKGLAKHISLQELVHQIRYIRNLSAGIIGAAISCTTRCSKSAPLMFGSFDSHWFTEETFSLHSTSSHWVCRYQFQTNMRLGWWAQFSTRSLVFVRRRIFQVILCASCISVVVLLARWLGIFCPIYFLGGDVRPAVLSTVNLSQVSEFALVIGGIGHKQGNGRGKNRSGMS